MVLVHKIVMIRRRGSGLATFRKDKECTGPEGTSSTELDARASQQKIRGACQSCDKTMVEGLL